MQGWFINQSGDRIDVEVGSSQGDLTLTSLKIDSDSQDTIYKPVRYTSCEFSVLTDDIRLYTGILLGLTINIYKNSNLMWTGIIAEVPGDQPFNYALEELSFSAVDRLTQYKSARQEFSKARISFKDFLVELLGEFYYFPFLDIDLDATFSYQAYMKDESEVRYKSEILESILEYLGVILFEYHGEYYIANPHAQNNDAGFKINSNGSTAATYSAPTTRIDKLMIHEAQVLCNWQPSVNSITLTCDYQELGSSNVEPEVSEKTTYWLSDNYALNSGFTTPISNADTTLHDVWGNELIAFPRTGCYPWVWDGQEYSYQDTTKPLVPDPQYNCQIPNGMRRDTESIVGPWVDHGLTGVCVTPKTFVYYNLTRYGFSPYVDYYTWKKDNTEATGVKQASVSDSEHASGDDVLDTWIDTANVGGSGDEKKINMIEHSNYEILPDAGLLGCCEYSWATNQKIYNLEQDLGIPKGSPSFDNQILVYGTNGITYIAGAAAPTDYLYRQYRGHVDYAPSTLYQYLLCKRRYSISPTPLDNTSLRQHYIVFSGSVQFFTDWEALITGYSKALIDESFEFGVELDFLDDENNLVLHKLTTINYTASKDSNILDPIPTTNNVTWLTGINETGWAIPIGDVGSATKLEISIYPIFIFSHYWTSTDFEFDDSVASQYSQYFLGYNLANTELRYTNVAAVDHYLLNLNATIATGFVEQEEPSEVTPEGDAKDTSNTVYYWMNEDASLVGAKDLDISNKLCTYDGKMSTVSCPRLGDLYIDKVNCYYYSGEQVSEVFRFGQLVDLYGTPTLGFRVPIRGESGPSTRYTYPLVSNDTYTQTGFSYDAVTDSTEVTILAIKNLTEVELS